MKMDKGGGQEKQWKTVYWWGGVSAVLVVVLYVADIIIGTSLGGDLTALPRTSVERFNQFHENPLLGLYCLDLLNITAQIVFVPAYIALYAAHRKSGPAYAFSALAVFLLGTAVFVATNTALPMMDLAEKYFSATTEARKASLAGAGEALLARGAHGSPGVFIGFFLPNIAGVVMSVAMLRGGVFSRPTALLGLFGSMMILAYLVLVTFVPGAKTAAMAISAPGGIALMVWMALFGRRLFRLAR